MQLKPLLIDSIKVKLSLIIIIFLVACSTSKKVNTDFIYFRSGLDSLGPIQVRETVIKPNDILNIQVSSKSNNQEQAQIFNVPNGNSNVISGYQVSTSGTIDLPIIGPVKASGLTKVQLQSLLAELLTPYVKSPLVVIRFLQFSVNVLGEVKSPGTKLFQADRVSIIDAISASGDITDFGKKDNVIVIREENGRRNSYTLDLRSAKVFESPAYLLQPNDIIYVQPNEIRIRTVNTNQKKRDDTRFWMSLATFALSTTSFLIAIFRTR